VSARHPEAAVAAPWYRTITAEQWRALMAAKLGWMLDAMDFLLFVMVITRLQSYFGFDERTSGLLGTATLLVSAVGGLIFGAVADRIGRVRALTITVLIFAVCSLGAATSQTVAQLLVWRALLGIGMGGEWACGAALVTETWPAEHRTKASAIMQSGWALGYILAAIAAALVIDVPQLGEESWRWLLAIGVIPALFTFWLRRHVAEPDLWRAQRAKGKSHGNPFSVIFGAQLRQRAVLAILLAGSIQFGYWGLFFWLPTFLASPIEQGGAGLSVVRSMGWIISMQIGAYAGYLAFGFVADWIGRRRAFVLFLVATAALVPLYAQLARTPSALMLLSPVLGFFGHGYFGVFGAFLAELFPTAVRATGQGLTYNTGRGLGAAAPLVIGIVATIPQFGIGSALALTSAFFLVGAMLMLVIPDYSGKPLQA
jgi:putative sialic acid transporter